MNHRRPRTWKDDAYQQLWEAWPDILLAIVALTGIVAVTILSR